MQKVVLLLLLLPGELGGGSLQWQQLHKTVFRFHKGWTKWPSKGWWYAPTWWNCTASASAGLFPNDRRNQTIQKAINLGWSYFWWSVGLDQIWGINFWIHVGERNQPILLQFHTNILLNAKLLNLAECNHPTAKDNISLLLNSGYRVLQSF